MAIEILKQAKDALDRALQEKKLTQEFMRNLGPAVIDVLQPVLQELANNSKLSKEELLKAIEGIKIDVPKSDIPQAQVDVRIPEIKVPTPQVTVNVPDIKVPEFKEIKLPKIVVPKPKVTVNVPPIKVPDVIMPEEMNVKGWVSLMGVDLNNPLPVQLRDNKGNPVNLIENLTQINSAGGGGRTNNVTVRQLDIHSIGDGIQTAIAGTAIVLTTSSISCKRIHIMGRTQNTDYVVVGSSTVVAAEETRRGIPLSAGQSITMQIDNVQKVYIDSIVNGEGVTFLYEN